MAQLTIYLEDDLAEELKTQAKESKISQSRLVSQLIRNRLRNTWPASVQELAGTWNDFPEIDELIDDIGTDNERESL